LVVVLLGFTDKLLQKVCASLASLNSMQRVAKNDPVTAVMVQLPPTVTGLAPPLPPPPEGVAPPPQPERISKYIIAEATLGTFLK
jgi:hypothetical protein